MAESAARSPGGACAWFAAVSGTRSRLWTFGGEMGEAEDFVPKAEHDLLRSVSAPFRLCFARR